ncbi:AraC family transcriptional regulator [Dyella solisilvae]|uniref:AraC family transcriptional regulator n=1 Tax=Dyella solisilvae TaxID=1920168 RepID=A0A370K830_9GAMM|nr:AraC family transcriptional regulator [Dyella solisilvae]RDI98809.1 AraC family transcriptional regulator [Dyella solisilvae]
MDSLSQLVQNLDPAGTVELHCRYAGGWSVHNLPTRRGYLPYHVVLQGHARLRAGGEELTLASGDVVVFPRGIEHTLLSELPPDDGDEVEETRSFNGVLVEVSRGGEGPAFDMLCGSFLLGDSGSALLRTLPDVVIVHTADRPALLAVVAMMRAESVEPRPGSVAVVRELSTALFTLVLRSLMADRALATGVLALMADTRLARVVEAVLKTPATPWTLVDLAGLALMSRATFARQFAQLSGMTPMEWVTQVRMELAARLLVREKLTAGQVAERCGYASEAAFGRIFRRHHGASPGVFRREFQRARSTAAPGA